MKDNVQEIFPVMDEAGEVIGSATRGECHGGSMLIHPVVHLHVFDPHGRIYLQKRPEWKDIQPGKWDTAVGGHVDFGEDIDTALLREAREELGLQHFKPEFMHRYLFQSTREREMVHAYKAIVNEIPTPTDELDGGKFWTLSDITDNIGKGVFTPNFESEFSMLFLTDNTQD